MHLKNSPKEREISLKGAVQINHSSYFVYKDKDGQMFLDSGSDENLHRTILEKMLDSNPFIIRLLRKYRLKPFIQTNILKELSDGHMNDTCAIAQGVYSSLSDDIKKMIDIETLKEASMLHDLGKVLIPSKILNKPSKLTIKERKIMNIHSTLGYELLKNQPLSEETLSLIKYHHQNLKHSGYPKISKSDAASDIGVQIISIADKYSALREARVYRRKLSRVEALLILYKEVREGKILPAVYNALVDYARCHDTAC